MDAPVLEDIVGLSHNGFPLFCSKALRTRRRDPLLEIHAVQSLTGRDILVIQFLNFTGPPFRALNLSFSLGDVSSYLVLRMTPD